MSQNRDTARSIVEEAATGRALLSRVDDAGAKVALLQRELELSQTLEDVLETLQIVVGLVDGAHSSLGDQEVPTALQKLLRAEKVLTELSRDVRVRDCRAIALLEKRISTVRGIIVDEILEFWRQLVTPNVEEKSITVLQEREDIPMTLDALVDAMSILGLLETGTTRLHRDIDALIISPCFNKPQRSSHHQIHSTPTEIHVSVHQQRGSASDRIRDVYKLVAFIKSAFPLPLSSRLLHNILPSFICRLLSDWLDPSLPLRLDNLLLFKELMSQVEELSRYIANIQIEVPSDADLSIWLKKVPQAWLSRKKESSLLEVRSMCYSAAKSKKSVDRMETQVIHAGDTIFQGQSKDSDASGNHEDWDSGWDDQQEVQRIEQDEDEDEDTSAWDQQDLDLSTAKHSSIEDEDEEAEAWGWGDDDTVSLPQATIPASKVPPTKTAYGNVHQSGHATREITLRESYTVTGIPDGILDAIRRILTDANTLASPDFILPSIVPATMGLATIPTLLLAMYRATAGSYYASDLAGQMLIYNDAVHLSGELKSLLEDIPAKNPLSKRLQSLMTDISSLEQFSRRAYGREMDSQRTILLDILSSTSGFVNSTAPLNAKQYSTTVQDAVSRVRDVDRSWHAVLSDSTRLQSLGSLTGTLVKQMISDILERADDPGGISEDQSKILKSFCDEISKLADLFTEPGSSEATGQKQSLVHVYTPDWFRFQYLGEILDASLADIRYLWTEGELKLEFRSDEVADLIQALFADSTYKRDAIRDIRKSS